MATLHYGDNLDILRHYLKDETVDLVYLDPPFNAAQNHNAFFQEKDGTAAAAQIQAFEDTWHHNPEGEAAYRDLTEHPGKVSEVMQAFMTFLGWNGVTNAAAPGRGFCRAQQQERFPTIISDQNHE